MNTRNRVDRWAEWLIRHAARSAPASLAERLEEEWLADLAARRGVAARLRLALGCCWATRVIAREFAAPVMAAKAAGAAGVATVSPRFDSSFISRRTTALFIILGLHVALIYGFTSGLAQHVIAAIPETMTGVVLDEPYKRPPPPPIPEPTFKRVPVEPVEPIIKTIVEPPDGNAITELQPEPPMPTQPPLPARPVTRVIGGEGRGFPSMDEFYPAQSIRLDEQGASMVRVCVDEQGRLTGEPQLAHSSGYARLDAAALKIARAASGHYRPTTEDGRPVQDCYPLPIHFQIK